MARTLVKEHNRSRNYLINGNFDFWQRGTTVASTSAYGSDRWRGNSAIAQMQRVDSSTSTGLPSTAVYGNRVTSTAGGGVIAQRIEADALRPLLGKTVTLSFKAGLVSGTPNLAVTVRKANSKDNWSGSTVVYTSPNLGIPASHTTTFTSYSYSFLVDADMVAKGITVELGNDVTVWTVVFSQVMLNEGSSALPFRTYGESIERELIACQRYYQRNFELRSEGTAYGTNNAIITFQCHVTMRVAPTIGQIPGTSLSGVIDETGITSRTPTVVSPSGTSVNGFGIDFGGTTYTANRSVRINADVIFADAEL